MLYATLRAPLRAQRPLAPPSSPAGSLVAPIFSTFSFYRTRIVTYHTRHSIRADRERTPAYLLHRRVYTHELAPYTTSPRDPAYDLVSSSSSSSFFSSRSLLCFSFSRVLLSCPSLPPRSPPPAPLHPSLFVSRLDSFRASLPRGYDVPWIALLSRASKPPRRLRLSAWRAEPSARSGAFPTEVSTVRTYVRTQHTSLRPNVYTQWRN